MDSILHIIHNDGRFEIAEHASYVSPVHPLIGATEWKVYPNEPIPENFQGHNPSEMAQYHSDPQNQLGKFKFDESCLDFQPDIVTTNSDPWYDNFIPQSAYRSNFKLIHLATVDGFPLKAEFFDLFKDVDYLMTYSEFGKNTLEHQSGGLLDIKDVAPPAVDLDTFRPGRKQEARTLLDISPQDFILGTTMRNQPRKLFPDLLRAFAKYLEICQSNGRHDLVQNSKMYWHTTNPDMGWDIPTELRLHNLAHKVLFTYVCDACKAVKARCWSSERCHCDQCGNLAARLPNPSMGVTRDQVALINSAADLYIQYATNGGWEMGINEAKACGVPAMTPLYSAMAEQGYNGGGIPLKVECLTQEPITNTNQLKAQLDNTYAAQQIFNFVTSSDEAKIKMGLEARSCVTKFYTPQIIADKWMRAFTSFDLPDQRLTWRKPLSLIKPNVNIPQGIDNRGFIWWMFAQILHRPDLVNTSQAEKMIAMLDNGYDVVNSDRNIPTHRPVDRNLILNHFINLAQEKNKKEQLRWTKISGLTIDGHKVKSYSI